MFRQHLWSMAYVQAGLLLVVVAHGAIKTPDDALCEQSLQPKQGIAARLAARTRDYLKYQNNLHFEVNPADRDLFSALVADGVVERGSIVRGDKVDMNIPSVRALPVLHVKGREYVPLRVAVQSSTAVYGTAQTISAEIFTGGRSYQVSLITQSPRVQEFLAAHPLVQAQEAQSMGLGPYRTSQAPTEETPTMEEDSASPKSGNLSAEMMDQVLRRRMQVVTTEKVAMQIPKDLRIFDYRPFVAGRYRFGADPDDEEREEWEPLASAATMVDVADFQMGNHIPRWVVNLWRMETNRVGQGRKLLLSFDRKGKQSDGDYVEFKFKKQRLSMNANHPATNISFDELVDFVSWFNNIPEIKSSGCIYYIPSQREWEYAARYLGPGHIDQSPRLYYEKQELDDHVWYEKNSNDRTHAIGLKAPHPNGLYDMFGNVDVWTTNGDVSSECATRGGPFWLGALAARITYGHSVPSSGRYSDTGARLVRICR